MDAFRARRGLGRLMAQQRFLTGYGGVGSGASWGFKMLQDAEHSVSVCLPAPLEQGYSFGTELHSSVQGAAVPRRGSGKEKSIKKDKKDQNS